MEKGKEIYIDDSMKTTNNKQFELMKLTLPHVNFEQFEIVDITEVKNVTKRSDLYDTRILITIEENSIPPDDSWDWYAHWFKEKQINDRPLRNRTVTLIIKRRRWKNKKTWATVMSKNEWIKLLPGTKRPEDILTFLK